MNRERSVFACEMKELYRSAFEGKLRLGEDLPLDAEFFRELEFYSFVLFDVAERKGVREETYWRFPGEEKFAEACRLYFAWIGAPLERAVETFFATTRFLAMESVKRDGMISPTRFPLQAKMRKDILCALGVEKSGSARKTNQPREVL